MSYRAPVLPLRGRLASLFNVVIEESIAEHGHRERAAISGDVFGRVAASRYLADDLPGTLPCLLNGDRSMPPETDPPLTSANTILREMRLSPRGQNTHAKSAQIPVPDEVVLLSRLKPLDRPLRQFFATRYLLAPEFWKHIGSIWKRIARKFSVACVIMIST